MPEILNRPPRIQPELPVGEVEVPGPPAPVAQQSLLQIGVPLVTIAGYILVSTSNKGSNPLFVLPMALSVVASTFIALLSFRRNSRIDRERKAAYAEKLRQLRTEMLTAHDKQRAFYLYSHSDPHLAMKMAGTDESEADARLWERRTTDEDFGTVRIGVGTVPSTVIFKLNTSSESIGAPLAKDSERLVSEARFVNDVPVAIPLRPHYKDDKSKTDYSVVPRHAIGISGPNAGQVRDMVRAMLVSYASFHAPNDARLYIVGSTDSKSAWDWARWMPHANASRGESSAATNLIFEQRKVRGLWDALQTELERRAMRLADKDNETDVTIPFLLVVIDALTDTAGSDSPLRNLEAEAAVSMLLQQGPQLGAAIIFLVPEYEQIPSECRAVVQVGEAAGRVAFRYAEVGVNSERHDGTADCVAAKDAEMFARRLAPMAVRTTYGADLAQAVNMLELFTAESVDQIPIIETWRKSRMAENSEWLHVPVGFMVGNKMRELVFSADGDGVHGLAAGTTGSGKSELLLTIVMGLAVTFDPSVVNFVLVDYKGGTAFEPLRKLPHVVDIVTNLQGMAGARTFTALRAELNRRSKILADTNTKHIVHYRSRNLHMTREPFPFLFVIIDEFAEMIKEMPEFKVQLDSIARLGRALGVHLLLATQRPSGVVSDQMRANMKFRICLRVETPEDSRELLRRSDAAFLPPNIPGRAYLQVGNENVELMQVARAGGPYTGSRQANDSPAVLWLNRVGGSMVGDVSKFNKQTQDAAALSDVLVEISRRLADENEDVKPQKKPWPDALPHEYALDSEFLNSEPNHLLPLSPALIDWEEGEGKWPGIDWTDRAMKADIGLIDNPAQAEQLRLTIDLTRGQVVIFGSSGYGKTLMLRSIMLALAATHSPDELNMYVLDFGGRGLDILQSLPHVGANILPAEEERVLRLLRKLIIELERRKTILSQARADNLIVYNANNPDKVVPAILVALDNFAGFRENYEAYLDPFLTLARDGRSYGIHFVVTGEALNAMPGKLYSVFTERFTLKLADGDYGAVVGRGVMGLDDIPGRGLVSVDRRPLEFQFAKPVSLTREDENNGLDEAKKLIHVSQLMSDAWRGKRPENIDTLKTIIPLHSVLPTEAPSKIVTTLGLEDLNLEPAALDLQLKGPHFIVLGPPLSGKTTTLRSWVLSLAHTYSPEQVGLVLIDFQQRFFKYGGKYTLGDLPQTLMTVAEPNELATLIANLRAEYETPQNGNKRTREIFMIADNYDDFGSVVSSSATLKLTAFRDLADLARKYGPEGFHVVLGGSLGIMRATDDLMRQALAPRYGLGLDASDAPSALGGRVRSGQTAEFPPGRGYIVKSGRMSLVQVATPQDDTNVEGSLDAWVEEIASRYTERAKWSHPVEPVAPAAATAPATPATPTR